METILIREARMEDSNKLNELLTKLIVDEKKYDKNINEKCVVNSYYENYINQVGKLMIVAEENNEIVGYLYAYELFEGDSVIAKTYQLDAMYVEEAYREQQIGSKLMTYFKEWIKNNEIKYIEVKVCEGNNKAINLYKKNGFEPIKEVMRIEIS